MDTKTIILLLLAIFWMHSVQSEPIRRCDTVPPRPLKLEELAGVWYEVGRHPLDFAWGRPDILKCLNVTVPRTAKSELVLDLEYIATYTGTHRAVKETVSFPWNKYTQNSIFILYYGQTLVPAVTYRVPYIDDKIILICGYSRLSRQRLFKVLYRQREPDKEAIEKAIEKVIGNSTTFIFWNHWTDQTNCNAANRSVAGNITLLALVIVWMLLIACLS